MFKGRERENIISASKLFFYIVILLFTHNSNFINAQAIDRYNTLATYKNKLNFEHYTTKQGLSQNAVYNILQDRKGFLWFCTQDGLNRFNGYEFRVFRHNAYDTTSLCHSFINRIYQDSKDRIWVCTEGGLALYNTLTESFTNFIHDDSNPQSIESNYVWTIYEDGQKSLWVGTRKGLSLFDPDKKTFESVKILSPVNSKTKSINVDVIFEDNNINLWAGTRGNGLFRIWRSDNKQLAYKNYSVGNNDVREITDNSNGVIYAGTFGAGLYEYDSTEDKFNPVEIKFSNSGGRGKNTILSIFKDPVNQDILWLGTEEDGIILVDTKLKKAVGIIHNPDRSNNLSGNMVYSIYKDRFSVIWIGTNEGINKINPRENRFEHFQIKKEDQHGISSNTIGKIIEDHKGMLWIGTDGGGVNKFDRAVNKFTHFINNKNNRFSISSNRAMIVFEDHTGTIWIGTFGGGLNKFNRVSETFESYTFNKSDTTTIGSDYITSIVEDKEGYLWIGTTTSGINRFDPKTRKFRRFINDPDNPESLSGNHVWILYIDKTGVLWAGTKTGGLNAMIDMKRGKFKRFLHNDKKINSINDNTVHAIFEDTKSNFWIGTPSGLNKLDRNTGIFTDYQQKRVFPQFRVIGIMEDSHDRLWLMTEKALIRFNPLTNETKYYDSENGMMINDFRIWAHYKNKKGEMFVGGANGFAIFHPDSLKDNSQIPPVVIDKFERFNTDNILGNAISGKGIPYRNNIELSYKDNIFSFSFAALNFINSGRNQYAYKLEGFNEDWIKIGTQNKVTFTNIDPGSYTFRVKGSNDDGVWNENGATIGIIISPPFWITWWFRSFVFLIIIILIWSFVRNKLKEVERHHKEQEAFARQLIETEELERRRIANELHDSLGQNLLVIKNTLLVKQQQTQIEGKSLEETSELVSQTIQEVRSISHNLRPHLLDQLGLTKTLKSLINQLKGSSDIKITAQVDDLDGALEPQAEINLFRIIQECFNNIIKHSGATEAGLIINRRHDSLDITVKDNGIGMNLDEIKRRDEFGSGFGISGMEKRAHVFDWKYFIESRLNTGTEIKINIPLKRNS